MQGPGRSRRLLWVFALVCVGLQMIVAVAMLWTMFGLSTYGEVARRPTFSWAGLLLPLATAAGASVAALAVWRARHGSASLVRLALGHGAMLTAAGILTRALARAPVPGRASLVLLQPGSRLPPNEIFGSESVLGGIVVPVLAAGVLAIPGLLLSLLLVVADRRRRSHVPAL
jgi:hypothetical protein